MVEFALVLVPLLVLVTGLISFGIGLNFWFDLNRIANQGARWAVVNCGPPAVEAEVCTPSLETYLEAQRFSQGNTVDIEICYEAVSGPGGTPTVGDPVTVTATRRNYSLVPFLGDDEDGNSVSPITMDLVARATMRLEQVPSKGGLTVPPALVRDKNPASPDYGKCK